MLECNRYIRKRLTVLTRVLSLLLPIVCAVLLLSQVVSAKNTYLINDGDRTLLHTTYATDPKEVLIEAGLELGKDDTFTTQSGGGMSQITVQRLQTVQIVHDGTVTSATTYGQSVASLLEELELTIGEYDAVSESLDAATYDGMRIVITRATVTEETQQVHVPYGTWYILDSSLERDERKELSPGVPGLKEVVDKVCTLFGEEVYRENIRSEELKQPVRQIVAVGSVKHIDPKDVLIPGKHPMPETVIGNGQLHIGGGVIITPDGKVLTYKDTLNVVATAYHNTDPGCTIYTAIGTLCRVGAIAVDPKVIPYGTRMYIVTDDGEYIYGIAVAEDCGSAIKGNRVDLYFDTTDECWEFGIRDATVYFLN